MLKTIQSIILDFHDLVLETGVPRRLNAGACLVLGGFSLLIP